MANINTTLSEWGLVGEVRTTVLHCRRCQGDYTMALRRGEHSEHYCPRCLFVDGKNVLLVDVLTDDLRRGEPYSVMRKSPPLTAYSAVEPPNIEREDRSTYCEVFVHE